MDCRESDEGRDDEKPGLGGGRCDNAEMCMSTPLVSAEFPKGDMKDT